MKVGAIYVDDTGNPGACSGSNFLPDSRKSWTAVLVPSVVAPQVDAAMTMFLRGVQEDFGADELHFTDIWSGGGVWKDVAVARRSEIITLMAEVMGAFALPIVHQTVSDIVFRDHPTFSSSLKGGRVHDWKLDDLSHFGLLMLCSQMSQHVLDLSAAALEEIGLPLPLFVDEGILPAGQCRDLPNWSSVIAGPQAQFRASTATPGLQLADFAAFIINRSQWTAVTRSPKAEFSLAEEVVLRAASRLNVLNLPQQPIASAEWGREAYEMALADDREQKGLPRNVPRGDKS